MIPDSLKSHFIRGFFDGDGSCYIKQCSKKIYYCVYSFCLFEPMLNYIKNELPFLKVRQDKRTEGLYELYTNKQNELLDMYIYMYNNANIYLKRKKNKSDLIKEFVLQRLSRKGVPNKC